MLICLFCVPVLAIWVVSASEAALLWSGAEVFPLCSGALKRALNIGDTIAKNSVTADIIIVMVVISIISVNDLFLTTLKSQVSATVIADNYHRFTPKSIISQYCLILSLTHEVSSRLRVKSM